MDRTEVTCQGPHQEAGGPADPLGHHCLLAGSSVEDYAKPALSLLAVGNSSHTPARCIPNEQNHSGVLLERTTPCVTGAESCCLC